MNMRASSISPASRNAPARCGPPSSSSDWTSRAPSSSSASLHARALVLAGGDDHVDAGGLERLHRGARGGARADHDHGHLGRRRARAASRAAGAPRSRTRPARGWRATPSTRAVSSGSSASAVPMPDGHRVGLGAPAVGAGAAGLAGDPLRVAGRGGDLAVERHRRLEDHERPPGARVLAERLVEQPRGGGDLAVHPRPRRRPRRAGCPGRGRTPCRWGRRRRPPRARCPASRIASVHGGVRPWWPHGSSETYIVAPAGSSLQAVERRALGVRPRPAAGVEALADHAARP